MFIVSLVWKFGTPLGVQCPRRLLIQNHRAFLVVIRRCIALLKEVLIRRCP